MENKDKAEFTERAMQKLMGKVLDLARISEMSERANKQFERTIKIEFNSLIRLLLEQSFGIVNSSGVKSETTED